MRPATIASLEVDGLKPARLLVVALLTFVLIVLASVAPAAGRVAGLLSCLTIRGVFPG